MSSLTGQVIKGYELRDLIGEGGFGAVYRAFQPVVKREVAVKVILPEFANQPDFIRRFEYEAELIARLEHPYIVPLYDYWREADHAYLVMRALRTNLRAELAESGAWSVEATIRLLDQIAAALTLAHRNGIIHRDIKPDNILLDEENNAYLADFGIALTFAEAAHVSPEDAGVGSYAYVAPEQLRNEPLTIQSDVYSLGIVLFETLSAEKPFPDTLTLTSLIDMQLEVSVPSLNDYRPDLPETLNVVIQKATDKIPAKRYLDALSLADAFRHAMAAGTTTPDIPVVKLVVEPSNPYKGLRAFQEADSADFFGRDALVQRLIGRLAESGEAARFLAVIGPSGSGKSSVVHAGLLPALRRGALAGSRRWFIAVMRPGAHPFESLEAAIMSVAVNPPASMLSQLQQDDHGLARVLRGVLPRQTDIELLLVIDQFEEVFTLLNDDVERARFLNSLAIATGDQNGPLHVIISLRADFMDRPLQYAAFGELIRAHNEFVLPLSPEELEMAISRPAERVGVKVEAELIAAIVGDIGEQPGTLPLLQYALTELFERQQGGALTLERYRAGGGVLGILARQAEELFTGLDAAGQTATRQLFMRLVTPGEGAEDSRRRVGRAELASLAVDQAVLDHVIDLFSKRRLLTFDRDIATRRPTIEVAHEALIGSWPRLREWLNTSREDLRIQRRLLTATSEWINANRETSFLADGARLDQFEAWARETTLALSAEEQQYLQASIKERQTRQAQDAARKAREAQTAQLAANFLRTTVVLAVVGLLAVIAIVVLGVQSNRAYLEVAQSSDLVASAQAKAAAAVQVLTPIPVTLTAAAVAVNAAQRSVEELGLAAEADKLLLTQSGNVETAALLSIRALNMAYLPEADAALTQAIERNYTESVFKGHTDAVYGVAMSPDGKFALTGGKDKTARLWDLRTGKTVQVFTGHDDAVYCVAFSPDGKYALTGSSDDTARLWDIQTGKTVRLFGPRITPVFQPSHHSAIYAVAFSPDSKYVVTGSRDGDVRLWSVKTGLTVHVFSHSSGVFGVAFSPDGKRILAGLRSNEAVMWDVQTGQEAFRLTGHTGAVWAVTFSPDNKYLLTGSGDTTARLWDAGTGKPGAILKGHHADVTGVAFSPDSRYALTSSADFTVRMWDTTTGELVRSFTGHSGAVWSAAFSPDGKSILTGSDDMTARLWNTQPNASPFIVASHAAAIWSAVFSPDGKFILTGSDDTTARIWDVQTRQNVKTFASNAGAVYSVAYSPDGKYAVVTGSPNLARLWDLRAGNKVRDFQFFTSDDLYSVAFSPDGKTLLTSGNNSTFHLWDVQTGVALRAYSGHQGPVDSIAFSPDGKYILTGSYDHTARLWDVQTGQTVHTLEGHNATVSGVAFSPDGKYAATGGGDNTARLWDVQTGQMLRTFVGHSNAVASVAFSPDGKYLLTGSADTTARLWDVQTGQTVRVLAGHTNAITSVSFSPDGKQALTASADGTARLWKTDYRDFVTYACTRVSQDFTDNERQHFNLTDKTPTCSQFQPAATPAATSAVP